MRVLHRAPASLSRHQTPPALRSAHCPHHERGKEGAEEPGEVSRRRGEGVQFSKSNLHSLVRARRKKKNNLFRNFARSLSPDLSPRDRSVMYRFCIARMPKKKKKKKTKHEPRRRWPRETGRANCARPRKSPVLSSSLRFPEQKLPPPRAGPQRILVPKSPSPSSICSRARKRRTTTTRPRRRRRSRSRNLLGRRRSCRSSGPHQTPLL